MKILHVLNTDRFSGAENVVCQIINMFEIEHDYEMVYCSLDGPIRETLKEKNITFEPINKMNVFELKRVIKKIKPDIIHAHDYTASLFATLVSKKIPVISHLHNNSPWIKYINKNTIAYFYAAKKARKILFVSDRIKNELLYGSIFRNKELVIGNPIVCNTIINKSKAYNITDVYDICFCGRMTEAKNIPLLMNIISEVYNSVKSLRVAIIGDGELLGEFNNLKEKIFLNNVITYYGFKDNPYPIMKNCKLLLMPSKWEGYGLVAFEAITLGVPVVCSNAGGLPNVINNQCGKICTELNEYIDEVISLLSDEKYHKMKSNYSKERAKELENIEQYKNTLKDIYETTINNTNAYI